MNAKDESAHYYRSVNSYLGDKIESKDGEVCGKCCDFLFDTESWTIRYVVAETGGILSHNKVLLSPFVFENPKFGEHDKHMKTVLEKDWIEASPLLDTDAPVSRRYEVELARHYKHPYYWAGTNLWGGSPVPRSEVPDPAEEQHHIEEMMEISESTLRSCDEIIGYEVIADGEEVGKVEDFIVETGSWHIRYFAVETGNWIVDNQVLLSPEWSSEISWDDKTVVMGNMDREKIKGAPGLDTTIGINRDEEGRLFEYYGHRYNW